MTAGTVVRLITDCTIDTGHPAADGPRALPAGSLFRVLRAGLGPRRDVVRLLPVGPDGRGIGPVCRLPERLLRPVE